MTMDMVDDIEVSITERLGSYYPDKRRGYSDSRVEKNIQDRRARKIYDSRSRLSYDVLELLQEGFSVQESCNGALMRSNLSPHSYPLWSKHVTSIINDEGGLDVFLPHLSKEVEAINYSKRGLANTWIGVGLFIVVIIILTMSVSYVFDYTPAVAMGVNAVSTALVVTSVVAFGMRSKYIHSLFVTSIIGKGNKKVSEFTKENSLKMIA